MRKFACAIVTIAVLVGLFWGIYTITSAFWHPDDKPSTPQITTNQQSGAPQSDTPSDKGTGLAFFILIAAIAVIGYASKVSGFANTLKQPVYSALIGVIVFYALIYIFAYPLWEWPWGHQKIFWGANIGFILFVYFVSRTEKTFKRLAYVIIALIVFGVINLLYKEYYDNGQNKPPYLGVQVMKVSGLQTRKVLTEIGGCESNNRQFGSDGKVLRGVKDPDDTGELQINKRIHAKLIKKHPEANIYTREGNYQFGEILVNKYGYKPWSKTKACWEPKVAGLLKGNQQEAVRYASSSQTMTFGPPMYNRDLIREQIQGLNAFGRSLRQEEDPDDSQIQVVEAPVEKWSRLILNPHPKRTKSVNWEDGTNETRQYTVRWNGLHEEDFPRNGALPKIPSVVYGVEFKSRESESIGFKIKFELDE